MPIVADYFDKNLHYDATHYLYEPEDMSELLNFTSKTPAEKSKDKPAEKLAEKPVEKPADKPTKVPALEIEEQFEAIQSVIEKVEESVKHDLVPLLPGPKTGFEMEIVEEGSPVAALAEALVEGLVKAEAEAVKQAQEEIAR